MSSAFEQPVRIVGLKYEAEDGAPQVILKASGEVAEEVLSKRRHCMPAPAVVKNETLLEQLFRLPIDSRIGPELYGVVAVLLAHVLAVEEKLDGDASA